jgi:hypothetical protein
MNDMHISAHARSEGLVLVTSNMEEFGRVPALEAENWVDTAQQWMSCRAPVTQKVRRLPRQIYSDSCSGPAADL